MVVLDRFFFNLGDKKVVTGHVKQVVVLYSNDCMGICLGGPSICRLRRVVVLQRWLLYFLLNIRRQGVVKPPEFSFK